MFCVGRSTTLLYSTLLCTVLLLNRTVRVLQCRSQRERGHNSRGKERKKERQRRTLDPDCGITGETDRPRLEQGTVGSN